jgi:hypothetical protein
MRSSLSSHLYQLQVGACFSLISLLSTKRAAHVPNWEKYETNPFPLLISVYFIKTKRVSQKTDLGSFLSDPAKIAHALQNRHSPACGPLHLVKNPILTYDRRITVTRRHSTRCFGCGAALWGSTVSSAVLGARPMYNWIPWTALSAASNVSMGLEGSH